MTQRLFLIDIDDTVFDTARLKLAISSNLLQLLGNQHLVDEYWQLNKSLRHTPFHIQHAIKTFCENHGLTDKREAFFHAFLDHDFASFLYPDVSVELPKLKDQGIVALFSTGDGLFQQVKVQQSGLANMVNYAFIYDKKSDHLVELITKFQTQEVWFVDNQHELLDEATQLMPNLKTAWMQRKPLERTSNFEPTVTISNLSEFHLYLENTRL